MLELHRGGAIKGCVVKASTDLAIGQLVLAPLVKMPQAIVTTTASPYALQANVQHNGQVSEPMWIIGSASLPSAPTAPSTASSSADAVTSSAGAVPLDWKSGNFPWPFWLVRRVDCDMPGVNCKLTPYTSRVVNTFGASSAGAEQSKDAVVVTVETEFPVMVNTKAIQAGEDLVVLWPKASVEGDSGKDANSGPKTRTWEQEYSADLAKRRKRE